MNFSVSVSMIRLAIPLFALAGLLSTTHAEEVPSLEEILQMERQIIESRQSLRSGRVTIRTRTPVYDQHPSMVGVEKRYVCYFEGDKIRYDRKFDRGGETSRQQQVFGDDVLIRAFPDDGETHLFGSTTRPARAYLPDPRRLGVVNWSYDAISRKGYEDFFLNPNRDQFKVEAGTQAGELIWKVSFQFQGRDEPLYGKYWLSRDKGGLPVYIEARSGEGEEERLRSITTALKKYGDDDVWFPKEVVLRIKRGGRVVREEVATVEDAVFGDKVGKETFALAGLGLPKGAPVNVDGEILFWNGDQLVPRTSHPTESEQCIGSA